MRLISNKSYIEKREKIGLWAAMSGIVCLMGALFLTMFDPSQGTILTQDNVFWITMALIAVGFLASNIGNFYGEWFAGDDAPYKKMPAALKMLDDHYTLLMYKEPLPFVLVDPGGVTVLTVKTQRGDIVYQDNKWRHREKFGLFQRMIGRESLGKPDLDSADNVERMRKILAKRLPEGVEVPVQGVVFFSHPEAKLQLINPPVPGFSSTKNKFPAWMREAGRRPALSPEARAALEKALGLDAAEK